MHVYLIIFKLNFEILRSYNFSIYILVGYIIMHFEYAGSVRKIVFKFILFLHIHIKIFKYLSLLGSITINL